MKQLHPKNSAHRIILVQPPLRDFYLTHHRMNALGLKVVRRLLEKAGCTVECFNFPRSGESAKISLPDSLSHLSPYLIAGERGPLSGFHRFRRFGPEFRAAASAVLKKKPDLVLIGLFAWAYGQDALDMAEALRSLDPGVTVGLGGAGLSVDPVRFEGSGLFDLLLAGEGERLLPKWIAEGSPLEGSFQVDPMGSGRSAVEVEPAVAWQPQESALSLSLSRGCPKSCSFCANRLVHGTRFRRPPVDRIMEHIDREVSVDFGNGISNGARVKKIYFEDDNLSADTGWFEMLLTALAERFPGVTMSAENGIDYRFLDPETLRAMHRAGFRRLNFSIASTDTVQLEKQGRSGLMDRYLDLVNCAEGLGMEVVTYFIAGLPGESPVTAVENLRFLSGLPTEAGISLYYPVPGIGGFEDPEVFRGVPFFRALGSAAWPWGGGYTVPQLLTAFRLARLTNLIKKSTRGGAELSGKDGALLAAVFRTQRLHTMVGKHREIRELPWADREMVELFLD